MLIMLRVERWKGRGSTGKNICIVSSADRKYGIWNIEQGTWNRKMDMEQKQKNGHGNIQLL